MWSKNTSPPLLSFPENFHVSEILPLQAEFDWIKSIREQELGQKSIL